MLKPTFNEAGANAPDLLSVLAAKQLPMKAFNEAGANAPDLPGDVAVDQCYLAALQ